MCLGLCGVDHAQIYLPVESGGAMNTQAALDVLRNHHEVVCLPKMINLFGNHEIFCLLRQRIDTTEALKLLPNNTKVPITVCLTSPVDS
jgi:hypothetical protein